MSARSRARKGPLYVQIADELREHIGSLGSGARIPSEPQLAKDWGVSRFTVAKAVEQLVDEGLITRRQGSGSFVAEAPLRRAPGYLLSFTEAVEAAGHQATHRLLAFEPADWEEGLPYPKDAELLRLDRLRMVDGRAVARHRSTLSAELADRLGLTEELASSPIFSLYRFFDEHGLSVHSASERLIACNAEAEDRKLLELKNGAVVVAVTRHSFAADGTPLDAVSAIYDARRYSYEARLVRRHHSGNMSNQENHHESFSEDGRSHLGPRLGPWSDQRDGG
ncbi:MAG TPA: GntR family transcriptional regulator [Rhizobiaceae bacterium]|nr:GntR family transcriptional regulator [Rhizobiaceae bacterium]